MSRAKKLKETIEAVKELVYPYELVEPWIDSKIKTEERPMNTGIYDFDEVIQGGLKGRVYAHVGYGGTRKSFFALQQMLSNTQTSRTGIYSTMEMSSIELFSRILDMSITGYNDKRASDSFGKARGTEKDKVVKLLEQQIKDLYGKNMMITQKGGMDTNAYRKQIEEYNSKHDEPLDMLVVDGLSMMHSMDGETNAYSEHSKMLKELAKDYNLYIPLICHCSKNSGGRAGSFFDRDNARFVRGSEKILDNCDGWFMFSLNRSEQDPDIPIQGEGTIRFYDKRHSGKTVEIQYIQNPMTLVMEKKETAFEPVQDLTDNWKPYNE